MVTNWEEIGHAINVVAMAALSGKTPVDDRLFAATRDNKLWWRDPVGHNVDWEEIGHAINVVAMTALNGKLYSATSDMRLLRRDPVGHNVDWEEIGTVGKVTAMAALHNQLFAATPANRLWRRDPAPGDINLVGIGHANNVVTMTALNHKLFAATNDNALWWRDTVRDVEWDRIGHANNVVAMTALNGKTAVDDRLYAATRDNRLWWRRPVSDQAPEWTQWPSIAATPPSTVYPPDGSDTWFPRTDIAQARHVQAHGRDLVIAELRGWLSGVEERPEEDPDWHYYLELDVEWLRTAGIDPAALMRPGDVLGYPIDEISTVRRRSRLADIECEVDAWPRKDTNRGTPPRPTDWIVLPEWTRPSWPWDPRLDAHRRKLEKGQYVKIVGSLVTDHPHVKVSGWNDMLAQFGIDHTRAALEVAEPDPDTRTRILKRAANDAAKLIFSNNVPSGDPANPARWNEIHSPDYVEVLNQAPSDPPPPGGYELPPKPRTRQLHQIMVCAQHGGAGPVTEEATFTLDGPPDRDPHTRLRWREYPTQWAKPETVFGPTVRAHDNSIEVSVTVHGDVTHGRFYQLYELWWEPIPPTSGTLRTTVSPNRIGEGTHNLLVSAQDSGSDAPVPGRVLDGDVDIGATNVSFRATFEAHPTRPTHTLKVRCPGYPETTVTLTVTTMPGS